MIAATAAVGYRVRHVGMDPVKNLESGPRGGDEAIAPASLRPVFDDLRPGALVEAIVFEIRAATRAVIDLHVGCGRRLREVEPLVRPWLLWMEVRMEVAGARISEQLVEETLARCGLRRIERIRSRRGRFSLYWCDESDASPVVIRVTGRGSEKRLTLFYPLVRP